MPTTHLNEIIQRKEHFNELNKYMSLNDKIKYSKEKIKEFFLWLDKNNYKEVTISFSGGKDSTVLFDLVNKVHLEIKSEIFIIPSYAMEITFPSTLKFIKNVITNFQLKNKKIKDLELFLPKLPWNTILREKGFPIFSKQISTSLNRLKRTSSRTGLSRWSFGIEESAKFKLSKTRLFLLDDLLLDKWNEIDKKNVKHFFSEKCCHYVKGGLKEDTKPSFVGTLANESTLRKNSWIKNGCNIYNPEKLLSRPISLWTSDNIWKYIQDNNLVINPAYNYDSKILMKDQKLHFNRLGCTSCPFGSHIEELKYRKVGMKQENLIDRFQITKDTNYWNRYEILKEYYPNLYSSQVHSTLIYRILIDMDITIKNDPIYMEMYKIRRKQIDDWYKNIYQNFLNILFSIESYKNKKEILYSYIEVNKALDHFKIDGKRFTDNDSLEKQRKKYKK